MEDLKQKHNYGIMYIVDDQKPEDDKKRILKEFCEILTKNNGEIKKEQNYIKQFAYPINKKVKGHYFIIDVLTSAKNITDFDRIAWNKTRPLGKTRQLEVMRYLIINLDNEKINKFKPKRQVESSSFSRSTRTGNHSPYNREENTERKPRPIAGTESSYRKTNYQNMKPKTTDNVSSTEQKK